MTTNRVSAREVIATIVFREAGYEANDVASSILEELSSAGYAIEE